MATNESTREQQQEGQSMTSEELDQKYMSAGSAHEEYRRWITRVSDDADDATLLRNTLSTIGQMESILMGIYAELVYARHTTAVVTTVPARVKRDVRKKPARLAKVPSKKRVRVR
jgi:hypothetical protein